MTDVIKSTLPPKTTGELSDDLLSRFPGVDHADLLRSIIADYFMDMKWGNKREERAACDFLNLIQQKAIQQLERKKPNEKHETKHAADQASVID